MVRARHAGLFPKNLSGPISFILRMLRGVSGCTLAGQSAAPAVIDPPAQEDL
jgi:hypothetical protein